MSSGAYWLRSDLHVHTPFDRTKRFSEDVQGTLGALEGGDDSRLREMAGRFFDACRDASLDLVAITDHNSIEGYKYLQPHVQRLCEDEQNSLQLLPGVELTVGGERNLHVLLIAEQRTPTDWLNDFITSLFKARPRHDESGNPNSCGKTLIDFCRFTRESFEDAGYQFILIPAHVNRSSGIDSEMRSASPSTWEAELRGALREKAFAQRLWAGFQVRGDPSGVPNLQELLEAWAAAFFWNRTIDDLHESAKQSIESREHWPIIEASDPNCHGDIGDRFTWLKMEVPDVEGIRLALLDPESRLRGSAEGAPDESYARIERVSVTNTDFFDEIDIAVNPCLTTIIGGRGTGKSTLLEYIRHVLDRAKSEDFTGHGADDIAGSVQGILQSKEKRDFGETTGTLLTDYRIQIDVVDAGHRYRVTRESSGIVIERDPGTDNAEVLSEADVRALLQPRILSQRQIAEIAKDPASQRHELDALLDDETLKDLLQRRQSVLRQLEELQHERSQLENRSRELPAKRTELQKVRDQIDFLEQGGRQDVLQRYQLVSHESQWFSKIDSWLRETALKLEEQANAIESNIEDLTTLPHEEPSMQWLDSVGGRMRDRLSSSVTVLRRQAASLRELRTEVQEEKETNWIPAFEEAREAYAKLAEEMEEKGIDFGQHEKLLEKRASLESEIADLETLGARISDRQSDIDEYRRELVSIRDQHFELRREQAISLEELDADVKLKIRPFGDRDHLRALKDDWFSGAGLQDRDWEKLVDYAMNGDSVPDQLNQLVDALRTDVKKTDEHGRPLEVTESAVATLLSEKDGTELTGHFFRTLERGDRIRLDEMERFLPEDSVEARVRGANGSFKPISTGSVGERSTAILSLLLSSGVQPLVIDQPEDDLDNRYVYDVVVDLVRRKKFSRQIIIATHNANIPVNGDAELIVALEADQQLGKILVAGSIDREDVKKRVSEIMEGSAEAFRLRHERYGF